MTASMGPRLGQFDQPFAATESDVEHHINALRTGRIEHLSERQLVSLDGDSPPCNGPFVRHCSRRRKAAAARLERALWRMREANGYRHGTTMVPVANVQG